MHMALNNAVCLNTVCYKYVILMYTCIHLYIYLGVWTCLFLSVCTAHYGKCMLLWWYVCWLLPWISFLAVLCLCLPGCSSAPLATHAYLFDVNESFRRANKAKSMEISKTNCNLLFIARCMARDADGGTERQSERERDPPSSQDLTDCLLWACTRIFYTACTAVYILYTAVYGMLSVPRCAALSMILTCSLRSRLPAACWLPPSIRTGSVRVGSFWFGFHFDTFSI